jgi:hypothetical protein
MDELVGECGNSGRFGRYSGDALSNGANSLIIGTLS